MAINVNGATGIITGVSSILKPDGSSALGGKPGPSGCTTFTSNGTWYRPSWCTRIKIELAGGGGGSAGHGENGGAGGYSSEVITSPPSSVSCTVGNGGSRANWASNAGAGSTTSFGGYLSATGGEGGWHSGHAGGRGGAGSGGNVNFMGQGGAGHDGNATSAAVSYFGGGAPGAHHNKGDWHASDGAPGAGGAGQWSSHNNRASAGRNGIIIVWEFE